MNSKHPNSSHSSDRSINHTNTQNQKLKNSSLVALLSLETNPDELNNLIDVAMSIERNSRTRKIYEFSFSIKFLTAFGERIVLTGETEFLGNWDPFKGIDLEWTEEGLWKAEILIQEENIEDFEYKYVCISEDSVLWESGENRKCKISKGIGIGSFLSFSFQDTWQ